MTLYHDTNLAAAIMLESARHAERLGIEGTMTLYGETIPEPEREVYDDHGEPIGTVPAVPAREIKLERSPAEWLEALEPYAEGGDFSRAPLLDGARWGVPFGSVGVFDAAERRWASGYDTVPVRRSLEDSRILTVAEREDLAESVSGSSGAHDEGPWRAPYSNAVVGRPRAAWERLPFVQKMQDEIEAKIPALRADCWAWAELLTNRLGVASEMAPVHAEWIATLDGFKLTVRFDQWWMVWIATTAPMVGQGDCLASIFCGDWQDPAPDFEDTPTARKLLRQSVRSRHAEPLSLVDPDHLGKVAEAARSVGAPASLDDCDFDRLALKGGYDARRLESRCRRLGLIERSAADDARRWLVNGLLPGGVLALVAGDGGSGKSTLLHELAVALASEAEGDAAPFDWLGYPINATARGDVIYATLEEGETEFDEREALLDPGRHARARLLAEFCMTKAELPDILDRYAGKAQSSGAPRLLVIDSASKFREGSEVVDGDVNAFLDPLEQFARSTGCCVVVIHHLNKGASGRFGRPAISTAEDLRQRISGHQAFINRPRLVLGMFRDSRAPGITRVGVVKQNLLALAGIEGAMKPYRRDASTMRHVPTEEPAPASGREPTDRGQGRPPVDRAADESAVLAALADFTAAGQKVTKTGPKSLFSLKHQSLSGIPRARVDAAVSSLIESSRVQNGANGLTPSEEPHSESLDDAAE